MTDRATQSIVEQVLVLRCQAGDPAAFAELVALYHRRVRYFLQKMLGRPGGDDRVDDVLQDLWLDVFRSIGKLDEPRAFAAWLYRLARDRVWRELRRRRQPAPMTDVDAAEMEVADDAAGPDAEFSADDADAIHLALGRLAPEHREVLLLRFVEDMSYEQIAAAVGCALGTVRSRLHYGKQALKQLLLPERDHHDARERPGSGTAPARR